MQMQMQTAPPVGFCKAVGLAFKNFGKCSGRSRRSEFWYFLLFVFCIELLFSILTTSFQISDHSRSASPMYTLFGYLQVIFILVILIPYISLSVRRLHDTGQSGFLFLVSFIPFIGSLILLFLCCPDSQQDTNEYGPSPKYISPQNDPLNPNDSAYGIPVNPYPQPNQMPPQVSPYPQPNQMPPQVSPYPQPNQMPPQVNPYPQPNQMPPQVNPYPQPNQMPPEVNPYPQPNQIPPQVNPYPQPNQMDQMQPQLNPYPQVDPQLAPNPQIPPPQDFDP